MIYTLMHKNFEVALMDIDLNSGIISKVTVVNKVLLPVGGQMNIMKLHEWWKDRSVPKTRHGAGHALKELGLPDTKNMLVQSLALSLNDCYWIRPIGSNILWEQVSLFRNSFVDIFGDLTFNAYKNLSKDLKNTKFLHASSQGELQKKWCIDSFGRRFLIKGNWGSSYQQSVNELFASLLHQKQGCNFYTHYYPVWVEVDGGGNGLGCYSFNFCSEDIESVSCWETLQTVKVRQGEYFHKFKEVCISHDISECEFNLFMSYQIMTDFLLSNTDRHLNNIAVLRDANTLDWIGMAPIYDSGNSMFFREQLISTGGMLDIETYSFLKREVDLLKYVTDRSCVSLSLLPTYEEFCDVYKLNNQGVDRVEALYNVFMQKVRLLARFQNGEDLWKVRVSHRIK